MSTKHSYENADNVTQELREWMAWRFAIATFVLLIFAGTVAYYYGKGHQIRIQERLNANANANRSQTTGALTPRQPDIGAPVTPSPELPAPPPYPGR